MTVLLILSGFYLTTLTAPSTSICQSFVAHREPASESFVTRNICGQLACFKKSSKSSVAGRRADDDADAAVAAVGAVRDRCILRLLCSALCIKESEMAVDQKKEDFRKYLERNGIIDALTKGTYIKQFLGGPSEIDTEALKHENEELKRKVEELQARIDETTAVAADPPH
eukprot:jgi/Hompol1/3452/HPOL_001584-RA